MVSKTIELPKPKFRICLWKNRVSFSPTFTKPSKSTDCFRNPKISKPQNQKKKKEKLINDLKTSTVTTNQTSYLNSQPKMRSLIKKSALLSEQYEKLVVKNLIGVDNYS